MFSRLFRVGGDVQISGKNVDRASCVRLSANKGWSLQVSNGESNTECESVGVIVGREPL